MNAPFVITSPSRQFTEMAKSVMEEMQFEAVIIEAVLEQAVDKVQAFCADQDVTAIISRGGTARMMRTALNVPVLVAAANDFDILFSMKKAASRSSRIAYVLSEADVIEELPRVTDFLQIDVQQFTFTTEPEIDGAIRKARQAGFTVFVSGSGVVREKCAAQGFPCEIVNTSRRTMKEIVRRAQLIQEVKSREAESGMRIQATFDLLPEGILYLDTVHAVSLVNKAALTLLSREKNPEVLGRPIAECIQDPGVIAVIAERRRNTGRVIDIADKMILVQSEPVWAQEEFIGTVLTLQSASELEKQEQTVRRQSHAIGMVAKATFRELEETALSPAMRACLDRAARYAATDHTVLIEGESGTGKEMIAQSIHNASSRRQQPFVAINCAALPQSLLESELFGYEEGSFTGAKRGGKPGYFELAHRGTLFLDELGLVPMHVQVQFLRVLQERQVLRVGGRRMIPVDVRIIAATNSDLMEAVLSGDFRQDLFYRINVLHVHLPPLRERREDIRALVNLYLGRFSEEAGIPFAGCDKSLLREFEAYAWPGNVRELMNYMMRLVVSAGGGKLTPDNLKEAGIALPGARAVSDAVQEGRDSETIYLHPGTMEDMQREIIRWHMNKFGGSRNRVCEALDISRTTLWKKLKQEPIS